MDAWGGLFLSRPKFSANLGFLWKRQPLVAALRLAGTASFDAVEFHAPYATPAEEVADVLAETGLSLRSLNTGAGGWEGDFGVAALPGREDEARALIDEAVAYAAVTDCGFVSVVAGHSGRTDAAERTYRENLRYAADRAGERGCGVLIEPLSTVMGDSYHLQHVSAAAQTIAAVGASNLHIMADTFHVMTMEGSLDTIVEHLDVIGHIQISGWPNRDEPGHKATAESEPEPEQAIDFATALPAWIEAGYDGCYGAEYTPRISENDGLGWLDHWRPGA